MIATHPQNGKEINIAMACYIANANLETCESIVVVADEWQNKRIGRQLMNILMENSDDPTVKIAIKMLV